MKVSSEHLADGGQDVSGPLPIAVAAIITISLSHVRLRKVRASLNPSPPMGKPLGSRVRSCALLLRTLVALCQ